MCLYSALRCYCNQLMAVEGCGLGIQHSSVCVGKTAASMLSKLNTVEMTNSHNGSPQWRQDQSGSFCCIKCIR